MVEAIEAFTGVELPAIIVMAVLLFFAILMVAAPDVTDAMFPLGVQGELRRAFSWFMLVFIVLFIVFIVLDRLGVI